MFATAKFPTPVLNTPRFHEVFGGEDGLSLPLDEQGLLRAAETVAFPGTKFQLLEKCEEYVFRVKSNDYPGEDLFVDERFLLPAHEETPDRMRKLPDEQEILKTLKDQVGLAYVWGGNWFGIPEMLQFYPPRKALDEKSLLTWTFQGLDCSGLLYLATAGCTPRNTSQLVGFGRSLAIQNKSPREIQSLVKPLDMIVWTGHVIIVLDGEKTIESRLGHGVVISPLVSRLQEVIDIHKKTPINRWTPGSNHFVINRWI
ncbi:MAG: hypothetical protein ACHQT8_01730 [Chlamydiales bacterium]